MAASWLAGWLVGCAGRRRRRRRGAEGGGRGEGEKGRFVLYWAWRASAGPAEYNYLYCS